MTDDNRIDEIEAKLADGVPTHPDVARDVRWLIARVRTLEAAFDVALDDKVQPLDRLFASKVPVLLEQIAALKAENERYEQDFNVERLRLRVDELKTENERLKQLKQIIDAAFSDLPKIDARSDVWDLVYGGGGAGGDDYRDRAVEASADVAHLCILVRRLHVLINDSERARESDGRVGGGKA